MIKKFLASSLFLSILIQTIAVDYSFSITAEERLEEVEKQLIAIANQIKQYEGEKTDLEKAILEIPLLVKSNLSEPVVSMSKLLRMKAGDTLNVNLEDTVDFYVENQKYFKAEMGELNGNASVKLATRNN